MISKVWLQGIYESPIWKLGGNEISFAGELDKWTMVSPNRFTNIDLSGDRVYISMQGVPGEEVAMRFIFQQKGTTQPKLFDQKCVITDSGRSSIVFVMVGKDPFIYCQDA